MPISPFLAPERDATWKIGRAKGGGTTYYSLPGNVITTQTTFAVTANTDYYAPFYVQTPIVIDQLVCEVQTGVSGNARIGFYRSTTDWQPSGAPLADSGNISTTSTGIKTYTPGTPIFVPRGLYLSVLNASVAPTFMVYRSLMPGANISGATPNWAVTNMTVSRSFAAFPTPGTAWDTAVQNAAASHAFIFYRISVA
jgi:hypothetical protein